MSEWNKEPDQINCLINLMNSEGCVLEDRVITLLSKHYGSNLLKAKQVFDRPDLTGRERVEIDALTWGTHYFIFEVKSSVYDWIFLRGPQTKSHFHWHFFSSAGLNIHASLAKNEVPFNSLVAESAFEVLADKNGKKLTMQNNKGVHRGMAFPERPSGREIVRPAARQLLKNLETLAQSELQNLYDRVNVDPEKYGRFPRFIGLFPVLVTNAKLYVATYDNQDIDDRGDLHSLKAVEEKPWLVYNQAEILRWGPNLEYIVEHKGFDFGPSSGQQSSAGAHIKSICVVNQKHLIEFIKEWK